MMKMRYQRVVHLVATAGLGLALAGGVAPVMAFADDAPVATAAGEATSATDTTQDQEETTGEVPVDKAVATVTTSAATEAEAVTKGYSSLEAALKAAKAGDTVTLRQNVDQAVTIATPGITLEGYNKTISATGDAVTVQADNVTLKNLSVISASGNAFVAGSASKPVTQVTLDQCVLRNLNVAQQDEGAVVIHATSGASVTYASVLGGIRIIQEGSAASGGISGVSECTVEFDRTAEPRTGVYIACNDASGEAVDSDQIAFGDNSIMVPNNASTFIDVKTTTGKSLYDYAADEYGVQVDGTACYSAFYHAAENVKDGGTIKVVGDQVLNVFAIARDVTFTVEATDAQFARIVDEITQLPYPQYPVSVSGRTIRVGDAALGEVVSIEQVEGGQVTVETNRVAPGEKVTLTVKPDAGKKVTSIEVTDAEGNAIKVEQGRGGTWSFTMPESEVTVAATFACDGGLLCPVHEFGDVPTDAWYHAPVDWAVEEGLLTGFANGTLGPEVTLSRGQLATVLYRRAGEPKVDLSVLEGIGDLDPNAFYIRAVAWATEEGVIKGYGDGSAFGPDDPVTREQFATILYRMAGEPETDYKLDFPDAGDATAYAVKALSWAVETGVLEGFNNGAALAPTGVLNRAMFVTMLMRISE